MGAGSDPRLRPERHRATAMAEQFCDVGRGITLCYEEFGDPTAPPMLLIMGLGTQMIGWPDEFCQQLAARGFHVVRFDNRDSGRSTHIEGAPPPLGQLVRRRIDPVLYTLSDMADDALGLMRALELEPVYNVQLHADRVECRPASQGIRVFRQGQPVRILHFTGNSKHHSPMRHWFDPKDRRQ